MPTVRVLKPADAPALAELYGDYEWWADRDEAGVREALDSTDLALGLAVDGRLVAAARVLTDFTYYATVYDVIVAADRRGEGLGETLLVELVERPELQSLPGLALQCRRGLVPYYESVGFELYDRAVDVPEGGTEELVRMTYTYENE